MRTRTRRGWRRPAMTSNTSTPPAIRAAPCCPQARTIQANKPDPRGAPVRLVTIHEWVNPLLKTSEEGGRGGGARAPRGLFSLGGSPPTPPPPSHKKKNALGANLLEKKQPPRKS